MTNEPNPFQAPSSLLVDPIKIESIPYQKAWFIFFLISAIGGGLAGLVVGGLLGAILGAMKISLSTIKTAGSIAGYIMAIPISYYCFRWVVKKYVVSKLVHTPPSNI